MQFMFWDKHFAEYVGYFLLPLPPPLRAQWGTSLHFTLKKQAL